MLRKLVVDRIVFTADPKARLYRSPFQGRWLDSSTGECIHERWRPNGNRAAWTDSQTAENALGANRLRRDGVARGTF